MKTTIKPANPNEIEEFYKAASVHLSALGVPQEYHEQLLNNELATHYEKLAFGTIGEAAPQLDNLSTKELISATKKDYTSKYIPHIGSGKAGLLKKVLLGLGAGGAALGIGAAVSSKDDNKKAPRLKAKAKKEAMDKTIEGGLANGTIKNTTTKDIQDKLKGKKVTYGKPKGLPHGAAVTEVKVDKAASSKVAEDVAALALYKAAKDHMVKNLNIPEPQATEILNNHFGIK